MNWSSYLSQFVSLAEVDDCMIDATALYAVTCSRFFCRSTLAVALWLCIPYSSRAI